MEEHEANARIHALWDEISAFGASRTDAALEHVMTELMTLIGAQHSYWVGSVRMPNIGARDPVGGWRPRVTRQLSPSPQWEALRKGQLRRVNAGSIDPSVAALIEQPGCYRILIRSECVEDDWFDSDYYKEMIRPFGIRDAIYVATPLGPDVESWLIFERMGEDSPCFGDGERGLLDRALRPMRWFHHQLLLHHGAVLAAAPLTPSERKVLSELLTEKTETEIAAALHLATSTVHTYCTRICRKFNVRGRAGLTALWLGKTPD